MIARPPGPRGKGAVESEGQQIKLIDEKSDDADKVILTNPVVEPIREQQRLAPRHTFDETGHGLPSRRRESIAHHRVLTHPRPVLSGTEVPCKPLE